MKFYKILLFLIIFFITEAVIFFSVYTNYQKEENALVVNEGEHVRSLISSTINSYSNVVHFVLNTIANDERVIKLMKNASDLPVESWVPVRSELIKVLEPISREWQKIGGYQMHIHTLGAVSLLRMHRPEKYGDNISPFRKTVVEAQNTGKFIQGYEIGRSGSSFRNVLPIFYEGKVIGSIEASMFFKPVLLGKSKEEHEILILVSKEKLSETMDLDINKIFIRSGISDRYVVPVSIQNYLSNFLDELDNETFNAVKDFLSKNTNDYEKSFSRMMKSKEIVTLTPFHDFEGNFVGYISSISFNEAVYHSKKRNIFLFHVFSIINFMLLLLFFELYKQRHIYRKLYKTELEKTTMQEKVVIQQSKMASVGEMFEAIAHQWRQPLNSLNVGLSCLNDMNEEKSLEPEDIKEILGISLDTVSFMNSTIQDFRDFIDNTSIQEYFDAKKAVHDVVLIMGSSFRKLGISVHISCVMHGDLGSKKEKCLAENISFRSGRGTFSCEDGCPFNMIDIYGVKNEFKQVILNLLSNAKDALRDSEVKGEKFIFINFSKDEEYFYISISDNAGGIPRHIIDKIFDLRFTTKETGTGIGLSISKQIVVDKMGGSLTAKNDELGAVFTIKFKMSDVRSVV